jgi:hypothetical protein
VHVNNSLHRSVWRDYWIQPTNAVPYDDRIGPLLEVPGGETRIGFWQTGPNQALTPIDCALQAGDGAVVLNYNPTNTTVTVATFELMATSSGKLGRGCEDIFRSVHQTRARSSAHAAIGARGDTETTLPPRQKTSDASARPL